MIVVAAIALTFFVDRGRTPDQQAKAPGQEQPAPPATSPAAPRNGTPPLAAPSVVEKPAPPSFDVVRVNPQGDAVIAGRAEPNAEVTVREGEKEIGKVQADSRGEWVLVPKTPLAPGSRELNLSAQTATGGKSASQENVVVVVPRKGEDIAGKKATEKTGVLAFRVPSGGGLGSTVLQKPGGEPAAVPAPGEGLRGRAVTDAGSGAGPASEPPPALTLDAIDYDDAGRLAVSGHAPDGARVHVYLDNRLLGAGTSGADQVWRVLPTRPVPPGLYTLRVDQVDRSGKVVARVETRFVRAEPLGALPRDAVVFVQPGNSLWRISRRVYGKGIQYSVIFEANREQIRNPDLIYPGQVFLVPRVN